MQTTPLPSFVRRGIIKFLPAGAAILTITSFASYAMGLLRDRIFARTFGAGAELDAYNASFIIPDLLLNIFVAGALAAGFIPVFSGLLAKQSGVRPHFVLQKTDALASSVINSSITLMLVCGIVVLLFAPLLSRIVAPGFSAENKTLLINLMRIMALSPIIFALSNSLGSMLVSYKKFLFYGLSPALYNLGIIAGTFFLAPTIGIYGAAVGTIAGALLHLAVRFSGVKGSEFRYSICPGSSRDTSHFPSTQGGALTPPLLDKYRPPPLKSQKWLISLLFRIVRIDHSFKTVIRLMIPKMFGHPVELLTFWGFTAIASTLGEGNITALNFARNFQSVPVSLFGIAFATAIFPVLSELAVKKDFGGYKAQFFKTLKAILFLTGASALFIFFAKTLIIKIFLDGGEFDEQDILLTASTLGVFTLAIPTESISHLLARAFYSLKNTVIPVAASILALGIAVSFAYIFSESMGILALPLGFFLGSLCKITILFILLNLRTKLL